MILYFYFFSGGPFIVEVEEYKKGTNEGRFLLIGSLHGAFDDDCSNGLDLPTIFTRIDQHTILKFIRKVVFNEEISEDQSTWIESSYTVVCDTSDKSNRFDIRCGHVLGAFKLKIRNAIIMCVVALILFLLIIGLCCKNQCLEKKKRKAKIKAVMKEKDEQVAKMQNQLIEMENKALRDYLEIKDELEKMKLESLTNRQLEPRIEVIVQNQNEVKVEAS